MRPALILTLTLLAGCANTPRIHPACELTSNASGYLVDVEQGQSLTHLLLHSRETRPITLIALNPVGARLFEGTINSGGVQVVHAPHYRGPEPETVLWAFALWQMRDRAQSCWPATDEYLSPTQDGGLELRRRLKRLALWSPETPETLTLPSVGMTFRFREME